MQDVSQEGRLFLERYRNNTEENESDFIYSMPLRVDLHLSKLQGQFVSLDAYHTTKTLGEGIVKLIDDAAKE